MYKKNGSSVSYGGEGGGLTTVELNGYLTEIRLGVSTPQYAVKYIHLKDSEKTHIFTGSETATTKELAFTAPPGYYIVDVDFVEGIHVSQATLKLIGKMDASYAKIPKE